MAKGPDPRHSPAPLEEVPGLVREGADEFNVRRFWHAHEAWESGWHALRAAGRTEAAEHLHGLILLAAGLENATRGKEAGFKRQFAQGLHLILLHEAAAAQLHLRDALLFSRAATRLYVDACRHLEWTRWSESAWTAPRVEVGE